MILIISAGIVGGWGMLLWLEYLARPFGGVFHEIMVRAYRIVCPLVIPAFLIAAANGWFHHMPFAVRVLVLPIPASWWFGHKTICKDKHGRRLRDAATGLVRRVGNRLSVQPVPVRNGA